MAKRFHWAALLAALLVLSACRNALEEPPSARRPAWAGERQTVAPQVVPGPQQPARIEPEGS